MVGAIRSLVKVIVCDAVAVLPHASVTAHVFVAVKVHPDPGTSEPTVPVAVNPVEQLSVTVAAPKAALIWVCKGLQTIEVDEPNAITGACISLVKVTVCDAVPVLPHASVVVHVFVTEREQPDPVSEPTVPMAVNPILQLSITLATVPNAFVISVAVGLHITAVAEVNVITGTCVSLVKVTVCDAVPELPQASVTVHVFVTEREQPDPDSAPTIPVAVNPVLQLSVTLAAPKAPLICAVVGLHGTVVEAASVITGT